MYSHVVAEVLARDERIRSGLESRLVKAGFSLEDGDPQGPVARLVIAPVNDCPVDLCASLSARNWKVIILAAIPRDDERLEYIRAGAYAYLQMDLNTTALDEVLAAFRREYLSQAV